MDELRGSSSHHEHAIELIAAHCRSLDPAAPSARERLEDALGSELTRKLIFALVSHPRERAA